MSLYDFHCARSGWLARNAPPPEETEEIINGDEFERLVEAHDENTSKATREVSASEFLALNKDKVRPS